METLIVCLSVLNIWFAIKCFYLNKLDLSNQNRLGKGYIFYSNIGGKYIFNFESKNYFRSQSISS